MANLPLEDRVSQELELNVQRLQLNELNASPPTLETLRNDLTALDTLLEFLFLRAQNFRCDYEEFTNTLWKDDIISESNKQEQLRKLDDLLLSIKEATRIIVMQSFPKNSAVLTTLGQQASQMLQSWKRQQQLAANGAPMHLSLDELDLMFLGLSEAVWWMQRQRHTLLEHLIRDVSYFQLRYPEMEPHLTELDEWLTRFWYELVSLSFVVEKQPEQQVIKTNSRFSATVRLLGTHRFVDLNARDIKVVTITEQQARHVQQHSADPNARYAPVSFATPTVRVTNGSGQWLLPSGNEPSWKYVAKLTNMQIPNIGRDRNGGVERRQTDSVLDVKMALLFTGTVAPGVPANQIQIRAVSLPVVVVVHHNQDAHACATVTWDNQFAAPDREYFHVPDAKPWSEVAEALNLRLMLKTGSPEGVRQLTHDEIIVLGNKFFREATWDAQTPVERATLTSRDARLPGRDFTFWGWFYAVTATAEKVKRMWTEGLIMGFVSKQRAEELLTERPLGTFIVRFSDSNCGSLVIVHWKPQEGVFEHLLLDQKDLQYRSLPERILNDDQLESVYPDVNKAAFTKHLPAKDNTVDDGYKRPM